MVGDGKSELRTAGGRIMFKLKKTKPSNKMVRDGKQKGERISGARRVTESAYC